MTKKKILVLCTGNSCRSQMAGGFLKNIGKDDVEVYSAGIAPENVNPNAVNVMKEVGIDISEHTSNHINEYDSLNPDFLISVCDHAKENCPFFPSNARHLHHNFNDPAMARGTNKEILDIYRQVRDEIKIYCDEFVRNEIKS
ncbi:arsenate reductase ArsC [Candidatus Amoebophilus asiaticus]|nr:arsenate reductase ArsC [Candidatus Amoebophilus asiaticus]